ncbi:hypothetical protein BpHYR1_037685 [Brachionus plicatilis]|uniref:Uncharacterized protein n=1 Tax=Brachionus plicatilis TaxID=10195 RepID=A0A3M7QLV8_BRAPC|nr:hypothetical protein BpHYR1_037685 [Brachionus plicatilis]
MTIEKEQLDLWINLAIDLKILKMNKIFVIFCFLYSCGVRVNGTVKEEEIGTLLKYQKNIF